MTTWSRDYDEFITNKMGKEYLDGIRNTVRYRFFTKEGMKFFPYLCYRFGINSVIDYGAGYHRSLEVPDGVSVTYYDPYIKGISNRPENSADAIVLYNVINGIEPDFLEEFVDDVRSLCDRYVFCVLRTPGLYGVSIETYRQKFLKRGFLIVDQHLVELDEYYKHVEQIDDSERFYMRKVADKNNEVYFAILKKDPNF